MCLSYNYLKGFIGIPYINAVEILTDENATTVISLLIFQIFGSREKKNISILFIVSALSTLHVYLKFSLYPLILNLYAIACKFPNHQFCMGKFLYLC